MHTHNENDNLQLSQQLTVLCVLESHTEIIFLGNMSFFILPIENSDFAENTL